MALEHFLSFALEIKKMNPNKTLLECVLEIKAAVIEAEKKDIVSE